MPRRVSKQHRGGAGNSTESLRLSFKDFSVYDYSRSSKDSPRNNLRTTSKLTRECQTLMDEQDWYEKDLSDFDDPQLSDEEREVQTRIKQSKQQLRRSKQLSRTTYDDDTDGRDYPLDLWFLIAQYISPEDVGRFSLICRGSNYVINTVIFWMRLFKKYNKNEANKIGRILRREHLAVVRTHVIKSLYQIHPIFQERLNKTDAIQKDPHFLRSARCVRIWHSKGPTSAQRESYNYYFEFRFDNNNLPQQIQIQASSPALQTNNQYTIGKDCCVLHLLCSNFVPIGPFMGMILAHITLNVSSDYRYHKLKMWFDSSRFCLQSSNSCASKPINSVVIIDPILCLKVYKWYNSPATFD